VRQPNKDGPHATGSLQTTFGESGHRAAHISFKLRACFLGQSAVISSDHSKSSLWVRIGFGFLVLCLWGMILSLTTMMFDRLFSSGAVPQLGFAGVNAQRRRDQITPMTLEILRVEIPRVAGPFQARNRRPPGHDPQSGFEIRARNQR
jgi:hypothetical protein